MSTRRATPNPALASDATPSAVFLTCIGKVRSIAATAKRGRQPLRGTGRYAEAFHAAIVALAHAERELLATLPESPEKPPFHDKLADALEIVRSVETNDSERAEAGRLLHRLVELELPQVVANSTGPSIPKSEQVVPSAVVAGTRGYIESLALQANGCYERRWLDSAAMMMRRLIEVLILDIYENHQSTAMLLDPNGRFKPLSEIVGVIKTDTRWHLNKQTHDALDAVRELGNLAAHQRRYKVRKPDVEALLPGFRLAVEELIHLANYR